MEVNEITSLGRTVETRENARTAKFDEKLTVKVTGDTKPDKTKGIEVQRTIQKEDIDGKLSDKEHALLIRYGFSADQIDNFEWVGITGARIHTDPTTGQKALWLTSKENGGYYVQGTDGEPDKSGEFSRGAYRLEIPIDDNYEPSKIGAYRAEDDYNVHFINVSGNLVFLQETQGVPEDFKEQRHTTPKLAFEGNSNIHIQGLDGAADSVKLVYPAVATFNTADYADSVVSKSKQGRISETNLKPGNHVFKNKAVKE